jgi:hypothetical protein
MFERTSRYFTLPDGVAADRRGRRLTSRSLRFAGRAAGRFRHTVVAGDRLDGLAYSYYHKPRHWWRICDANPEALDPHALLGDSPIRSALLRLHFAGPVAPWPLLRRLLAEQPGVIAARVEERVELEPTTAVVDGGPGTIYQERFERAVEITYNRVTLSEQEVRGLGAVIEAATGMRVLAIEQYDRLGKQIVIPPEGAG